MNGLARTNPDAEQLDPINAQHTGVKPPGAMRDQIEIAAHCDASLDELFHGPIQLAKCSQS
jgi:hypothetical protein